VADLGCLQYAARVLMDLGIRKAPLHVYGHDEDSHFARTGYLDYASGHAIDTQTAIDLGGTVFTFWRNIHPDPCFSMRIENKGRVLTYIADTEWTDRLVDAARNADLLICESSLYNPYKKVVPGHLTAGEAGQIAREAGAGRLVLSHLPHFGRHEDLVEQAAAVFEGPVELAGTGSSWEL
jgi:ribonuclease BN (tRNA processing enzyme)